MMMKVMVMMMGLRGMWVLREAATVIHSISQSTNGRTNLSVKCI